MALQSLDISELEARVAALIASGDIEGIALIDDELRTYLRLEEDAALNENEVQPSTDELKKLNHLYDTLTTFVGKFRSDLAGELRGIKTNQKGIKAYQSSK